MKLIVYCFTILAFVGAYTAAHFFNLHILDGVAFGGLIAILVGFIVKLLKPKDIRVEREYERELSEHLKNTASYSAHISNVISGINHEVQPWIGGIQNIVTRIDYQLNDVTEFKDIQPKLKKKLQGINYSCEQTRNLLQLLSTNVKRLNQYNNEPANLLETLESWVNITLMDRFIKDLVDERNFFIDTESLDWDTVHSPMLLAQVILNLVKNSIEHNPDILDSLKITFSGDYDNKQFIYKDNGKGIPHNMLETIFEAGITTKQNKTQHGFGLALCSEYCLSMGAILKAVVDKDGACFVISFEQMQTPDYHNKIKKVEEVGQGSGMHAVQDQRTITPAIKGDSTYASFGDVPDLPERGKS